MQGGRSPSVKPAAASVEESFPPPVPPPPPASSPVAELPPQPPVQQATNTSSTLILSPFHDLCISWPPECDSDGQAPIWTQSYWQTYGALKTTIPTSSPSEIPVMTTSAASVSPFCIGTQIVTSTSVAFASSSCASGATES